VAALADAYREKYDGDWDFTAGEHGFGHSEGGLAHVFRVTPTKILAFAKSPTGRRASRRAHSDLWSLTGGTRR
jgi:hypothetical protein